MMFVILKGKNNFMNIYELNVSDMITMRKSTFVIYVHFLGKNIWKQALLSQVIIIC